MILVIRRGKKTEGERARVIVGQEREFQAPKSMTPTVLGEQLAHLVWESFSDMLTDPASLRLLERLEMLDGDGAPNARAAEEALIFLLWAHTRGIQRAADRGAAVSARARTSLDVLHRAVYEDMVANGANPGELPIFEERVRARYARYGKASNDSDLAVGSAVVQSMTGRATGSAEDSRVIASLAVGVMTPVTDFYTALELAGC